MNVLRGNYRVGKKNYDIALAGLLLRILRVEMRYVIDMLITVLWIGYKVNGFLFQFQTVLVNNFDRLEVKSVFY
ncbi:MAG TPA: hypothetical protein DDY13_10095 [Cytophagales bacterium]|jgi:hypothetical protein|nr:hypothetical protein [Cytophagales bacterium]